MSEIWNILKLVESLAAVYKTAQDDGVVLEVQTVAAELIAEFNKPETQNAIALIKGLLKV